MIKGRIVTGTLVFLLCAGCLVGCGGEYAGLSENGAVSGSVVSGQAVEAVKQTETSHQYCTGTNLYWEDEDGELRQMRLDGSHKKKLVLSGDDVTWLICVDADYLYYGVEKYDEDEDEDEDDDITYSAIWRAPIGKDENGFDLVETEEAQELISSDSAVRDWGVNSRYIFYTCGPAGYTGQLIQYDRQSGEEIRTEELPVPENERCSTVYWIRGSRAFACSANGIFARKQDETKWTKFSGTDPSKESVIRVDENAFYYITDNDVDSDGHVIPPASVFICDVTGEKNDTGESGKDHEFIGKKQLLQGVAEVKDLDVDEIKVCGITNLFCEGDRLYVQVEVSWKSDGWYHVETMMFSQGREETELRYEKNLTECMKSHAKTRTGALVYWERNDEGKRVWHVPQRKVKAENVWCYCIMNAKAFISFYDVEKNEGRVGCFELDTGTFRWLAETDEEFYEPCYEDMDPVIDDCYNAEDAFSGRFAIWQEGEFRDN